MTRTLKRPLSPIAVCADASDPLLGEQASILAGRCSIDLVSPDDSSHQMLLAVTANGLEIRWNPGDGTPIGRPIRIDLLRLDATSPQGRSKKQPIAKAVGLKNQRRNHSQVLTVVDATAGLGEDAWLLASLGCRVIAIERNAPVASLLQDALLRASHTRPQIAERIELIQADARAWLSSPNENKGTIDVVYLDPMYPPRHKSARQRKAARMLRQLVGDDPDAEQLLDPSLKIAARVVVKRPLHAPPLREKPVATHKGKAVRYDVYASGRSRKSTKESRRSGCA